MAKVLVVDDDRMIRTILKRALEKEGHEVETLNDGNSLMEKLPAIRPDLIVLDVLMPGLDGMTLAYHIKFESRFKRIPILMLTSLTDRQTRRYSAESAVDCFMSKPVDGKALNDNISGLLNRGKVRAGRIPAPAPCRRKRGGLIYALFLFFLAIVMTSALVVSANSVPAPGAAAARFSPAGMNAAADIVFIVLAPVALSAVFFQSHLLSRLLKRK